MIKHWQNLTSKADKIQPTHRKHSTNRQNYQDFIYFIRGGARKKKGAEDILPGFQFRHPVPPPSSSAETNPKRRNVFEEEDKEPGLGHFGLEKPVAHLATTVDVRLWGEPWADTNLRVLSL